MTDITSILSIICIVAGIFFLLIGSIGIIRLPDFYSRTHATSKSDTLGMMLVILGLMIFEGLTINTGKLFLILLFILLANPIGAHALARAALNAGLKPLFPDNKKDKTEG
ncbi:monovalent cation/H(+) antiporter subunit G [Gracilimonas mengyeensis]|uniref:Multisubunit sodium/proton antiporter, MrpG subunit n=1 Tax=Gracilimonas mengyeensis TaxID=1302730 RepID=A0A521ASA0_9BACT|nr:monovalent cation/H(+) antiporter subunit G [Gracilimonas mengyeensis]SMO37708.1 multisubunit sodium/proton antiporter, MrpG subunit [Gracilimonas mengyeensis]